MKTHLLITSLLVLFGAVAVSAVSPDQAVVDRILEQYELDPLAYEVELLSNRLQSEDVDPSQLTVKALTEKEPLGLFTVLATIEDEDGRIDRGQVRMRVRKFDTVLVTSDRISRHDQFSETNIITERMEVTSLREQPVRSLEALTNCRARRNIGKGQILTMKAIEPVPDIDVGREVTIIVANQTLTITAPGKALQAGCEGDYVKVKNTATGKLLNARVQDASTVVVDL